MHSLAAKTLSLRTVVLLVAAVIVFGWLVALCETHEEHCHDMCTCALPCCQAAVISSEEIATTQFDVTGAMPAANQTALSRTIAPILRPPKA